MHQKANLRTIVRGAYDEQQLRVQMGNRLVANFRAKLGQEPGKKLDLLQALVTLRRMEGWKPDFDFNGLSDQGKINVLLGKSPEARATDERTVQGQLSKMVQDAIRGSYKRLTEGVVHFPRRQDFQGDEVISDYTELCLAAQYLEVERAERSHFRRLENVLHSYPIYERYLSQIRGIGPAMAGVIISELDPHQARYPSSFWKYAGLDVVERWKLKEKYVDSNLPDYFYMPPDDAELDSTCTTFTLPRHDGGAPAALYSMAVEGRTRKRHHLVEVTYVDARGQEATRYSITFNPFLKTKLLGVLAVSFLRSGNVEMRRIYDDYRHRLEHEEGWRDRTPGHRHNAALRYMIKQFLADLYTTWRDMEGLPVHRPYAEEKLGVMHRAG